MVGFLKIEGLVSYEHQLFLWLMSESDGPRSSTTTTHIGSRCSACEERFITSVVLEEEDMP